MSKIQILSVDDSKAVHAFIDRCLSTIENNFAVNHVFGVSEGLEFLRKKSVSISCILLDWEMPEINGYDGLPMFKKEFPGIPVIVLTSKNDPDGIVEMLERGASEYMMKPFTPDILIDKLNAIVQS